jgi:hypothetical protein
MFHNNKHYIGLKNRRFIKTIDMKPIFSMVSWVFQSLPMKNENNCRNN